MNKEINLNSPSFKMIEKYYSLLWNKEITIKDVIQRMYVEEGLSLRAIANELYISPTTVHNIVKQCGFSQEITWK